MTGRVGWLAGTSKSKGGLKDALDYSCDSTRALAARVNRAHRRRADSPSARRGARHLRHQPLDGTPNSLTTAHKAGALRACHYRRADAPPATHNRARNFRARPEHVHCEAALLQTEVAPLHYQIYQLTSKALTNLQRLTVLMACSG